ncbi:MAG: FAD-dependent oxidoreductase, partial [Rhodothermales bacterium]
VTTLDALRHRWGFSEEMIDAFFRPFLGGILLDRDLQASSRMFEFVFRMFSKGATAIPAAGMEAIPRQLAAGLPPPSIHLETRVARVEPGRVHLENGEKREARAVVVATEAPEAERLLGRSDASIQTSGRSTVNLYYSTDVPPVEDPVLVLGADPSEGPINNLVVLTNAAPSYAPPGTSLVSISVVGSPEQGDDEVERQVRRQLVTWYGAAAETWQHLRTYRIPYALPDQAPPFLTPPERPLKLQEGLYICGDHRRTASINGAMAAGRHAAVRIAGDLALQEGTSAEKPSA